MFYFPHFDIHIFDFYILEIKTIQKYTVKLLMNPYDFICLFCT